MINKVQYLTLHGLRLTRWPAAIVFLLAMLIASSMGQAAQNLAELDAEYLSSEKRLNLEQAESAAQWQSFNAAQMNQGISNRDYWIRFTLANSTERPQVRFLVSQTSYLDNLNVIYSAADGSLRSIELSDRQPFASRAIDHRTLVAPIELPARAQTQVYVQAYNQKPDSVTLGFRLFNEREFRQLQQRDYTALGIFYGALAILVIMSLVFAVMLRQLNALYYALFLLATALMWLPLNGLGFQWLWPKAVYWHNEGFHLSYLVFVFFALQFSKNFLQLAHLSPKLLRVFNAVQWVALVTAAIRLAGFYLPVLVLSFALLVVLGIIIPLASAVVWRRGLGYAFWSLLAWLLYAAGLITSIISAATQWLPWGMTPLLMVQTASMLESMFLMIGMATWLVSLELDRQKALSLANEDPLTGLGNRRCLQAAFEQSKSSPEQDTRPSYLIMIDLDYFKAINDTYGHDAGDQVLREVGQLLKRSCREEDVVTRYGGEEFAILLRAADQNRALAIAERIRQEFSATPTRYRHHEIAHTLCCGIAEVSNPQWQPSAQEMMRHADEALYQAKAAGRNQNHVYQPPGS
ncbi:diguanylate cyclase [Gilvimarinus sp. DA14]|uniref:sensor domain-containing diguanylate cyclase n=1 Tax=Gilvimarinus sp. DA14 TaxID=2956798 RepID=UPI0020B8DA78|nr:diguanylate cyclase [Gilvimarinus sp. DA14]UTF58659.1 sensor domain-containing diguanylate cyclase [Gilvimarinus sp. DA14]